MVVGGWKPPLRREMRSKDRSKRQKCGPIAKTSKVFAWERNLFLGEGFKEESSSSRQISSQSGNLFR